MSYRLYGAKGAGAAMIEAALAETGEAYEFVALDFAKNEQQGAAYRAISPTGKVPALVDEEGRVLTESAAILIALAERHPEAHLLPPLGSFARANALRWLLYVNTECYPAVEIWDYPERFVDGAVAGKAIKERMIERLRERWVVVEKEIAGEPWLLAEGFSIADLAIACISRWDVGKEWRAKNCPKTDAIHDGILARPKSGPVWKKNFGRG